MTFRSRAVWMLPLVVLVLSAAGQPPTIGKYNWSADYAGVTRHVTDVQAQRDTIIQMYVYVPHERPASAPPTVYVQGQYYVLVRDLSTQRVVYSDSGDPSVLKFEFHPGLLSATLRGVLETGRGDTLTVDLSWDATGARERRVFGPQRDAYDGQVYFDRSDFTERPARVTGIVRSTHVSATFDNVTSQAIMGETHQVSISRIGP